MKLKVNKDKCTIIENEIWNVGDYNVQTVQVELSDDFDGLVNKVRYFVEDKCYDMLIENNIAQIPYEATKEEGPIEIGVYGFDADTDILVQSTRPVVKYISSGTYTGEPDNTEPLTPSDKQQMEAQIQQNSDDIDELDGRIRINTNNISNLQQTKADKAQVNALSTQVQANTTQIGQNKADITALNNRVDQIPIVTKTSQLTNDSEFITKDVNNLTYYTTTANLSRVALTGNYNDLTNKPDLSSFATTTELGNETTARENADIGLQGQIDAITSSSDVKDIVGTYTELQNYDTSTLGNDDIIKVLQDSTHNEAMTYYRWVISGSSGSWQYIGQEGPYYTKNETETLLNNKQNEITSSNKLNSDLVNDENQTNKFVTTSEKTTWNNKYTKPNDGIPKTDLASEVQTSLRKADTALQSPDLTNYVTNTDYASTTNPGLIQVVPSYGTNVNSQTGGLIGQTRDYSQYTSASNQLIIAKGTLENVITGKGLENKYSRSEIKTGTWIDNKPVYRRIFTINLGAASNIAQAHSLTDLDKFWINQSASFVSSSNESLPSTWYYSSTDWARTWMTNTSIRFRSPGDLTNRVLYVAVEYTKTTD